MTTRMNRWNIRRTITRIVPAGTTGGRSAGSGVAYATGGKVKRVAAKTYIATPYSVDLMGDLIDELENSGLYM